MLKSSGASCTARRSGAGPPRHDPRGATRRPAGAPHEPVVRRRRARRRRRCRVRRPRAPIAAAPRGAVAESTSVKSLNWSSPGAIVGGFATRPSSSSHTVEGTLTTPKTSESRCSGSSTGGMLGLPGPVPHALLVVVERDRHEVQPQRFELVGQRVPGRQLVAAAAPGRPRDDDGPSAAPGQVDGGSVGVGQAQLGGEVAAAHGRTTRLAEDRHGLVAVDLERQRPSECLGELVEGQRRRRAGRDGRRRRGTARGP